jgi:hypothetical protein
VLHARSFGGDLVGRGISEVAQHLPADGGVAPEQPIDHAHRRTIAQAADTDPDATPMERFEAVRTQALQTITADITSGNHSNKVGPART